MTWSKLPPATDSVFNSGAYLNGPFTGEPTAPYTYSVSEPLRMEATEQKPPVENTVGRTPIILLIRYLSTVHHISFHLTSEALV